MVSGKLGPLVPNTSTPIPQHFCSRVEVANPSGSPVAWIGYGTIEIGEGLEVPPGQSRSLEVRDVSGVVSVITTGSQSVGFACQCR